MASCFSTTAHKIAEAVTLNCASHHADYLIDSRMHFKA